MGLKKHCHNCVYLGYDGGELPDGRYEEGFVCDKREYKNSSDEYEHIRELEKESYRLRSKKCCQIELVARECTGCFEMVEGHPPKDSEYDPELMCYLGMGCDECRGRGFVYDPAGMG